MIVFKTALSEISFIIVNKDDTVSYNRYNDFLGNDVTIHVSMYTCVILLFTTVVVSTIAL